MKKLIIYYSYEGRTAYLANNLAKEIHAEILPLQPIKEKKARGFVKYAWGGYQAVMRKRPKIEAYDFKLADYDEIVFASPVWAGTFAPPLRTFFAQENIGSKKVAFFFTHEGGKGKTEDHFKEALLENDLMGHTDIKAGKISKEDNWTALKDWAVSLNL